MMNANWRLSGPERPGFQRHNLRAIPLAMVGLGCLLLLVTMSFLAAPRQMPSDVVRSEHSHMAQEHDDALSGDRPVTTVRPISCEKLAEVPGKTVRTVLVDFPPGAHTPRHRHPGSVTAFVVSGVLRSQLNGGAIQIFTVRQSWFKPFGAIHDFAENASLTEPAQLLAVFITDADCGPLTIFE